MHRTKKKNCAQDMCCIMLCKIKCKNPINCNANYPIVHPSFTDLVTIDS